MNFVIYNQAGEVLRSGTCPPEDFDAQRRPNEYILEGVADPAKDIVNVSQKTVVKGGRVIPPEPPLTYAQARRQMYPRIEEQLDMIWHAMDENPAQRIEPFYSVIKAVKEANPKSGGEVFEVGGL